MTIDKDSNTFDEYYFQHGCGRPYARDEEWLNFFGSIADRIVSDFQPKTVLDAGCAMGFLVETLRERGVEAYGLDISDYAIGEVHESVKDFCWVGSVTDPPPMEYDLIVCIEVLEHMEKAESEIAIANLCKSSEDILFSSTPFDYKEATHFNVQPPEYWAEQYALHGFIRDIDYDATYITQWATRFQKSNLPAHRIVREYERKFFLLWKENSDLRVLTSEMRKELSQKQGEHADLESFANHASDQLKPLQDENQELLRSIDELEQKIHLLEEEDRRKIQKLIKELNDARDAIQELESTYQHASNRNILLDQRSAELDGDLGLARFQIRELSTAVSRLEVENVRLSDGWTDLEGTAAWRFINHYRPLRSKLFPPGTLREKSYRAILETVLRIITKSKDNSQVRHDSAGPSMPNSLQASSVKLMEGLGFPESWHCARDTITESTVVIPHQADVDIIVCVHNAIEDVRGCLQSIIRSTLPPLRLILVDDGSDAETHRYLQQFSSQQGAKLIRNETARGYTFAANQGLRESEAEYVVLLNSDVIVTRGWLDQLIQCADSDFNIGMVGPLTNTGSWQTIPELFNDDGDWASNQLPEGTTLEEMASLVRKYSGRVYPRIDFLNGFCLLIKRDLISQIGLFDEVIFGEGYGEENDYCIRTKKAGRDLAVADDTYLFHAQSRSYSHERRAVLTEQANQLLAKKHGQAIIMKGVDICRYDRVLQGVRARAQVLQKREDLIMEGMRRWEGRRVFFLLPIAEPGGGGHVVIQEAKAMGKMGVDVRLVNHPNFRQAFEMTHPNLDIPVIYFDGPGGMNSETYEADAVIATVYHSVNWLQKSGFDLSTVKHGYYIQDYEPNFFPVDTEEYRQAQDSYHSLPDLIRMTKTEWTRQKLFSEQGLDATVVGPSVAIDIFRPRTRVMHSKANQPVRIAAMIRPSTPRRQPAYTVGILSEIEHDYGDKVEIYSFGAKLDDLDYWNLDPSTSWWHLGILDRYQLATLFNEIDIFLDLSSYQAMGLSALEAMASGAAVVVPEAGGATSFAQNGKNAVVIDSSSTEITRESINRLISDDSFRRQIRQNAVFDVCQYSPETSAFKILATLFGD